MSVDRAERTGPTAGAPLEWNSVKKRVTPPSTPSSTTMSASLTPAWGRALGALSIFTISAARAGTAGLAGRPVSGSAPGATGGAEVDEAGAAVVEELAASFFLPPPLQAAPRSDTTTTATATALVWDPARS